MAGSWTKVTARGIDKIVGGNPLNMMALTAEFTADAANGSVPDLNLTDYPLAFITDIGVKRDATTPPNGCTILIKDTDGLTIHPNDTLSFAASGRYVITDRPSCVGGITLSVSGNSTNSAKAVITLYCVMNQR